MPTSLLCPSCSAPATFSRPPILACPRCGTIYPPTLQREGERALARDLRRRPMLLTIGLFWSGLMGFLGLLFLGLAPFDIGSYSINNEIVSGPEFLRRLGILWAAMGVTSLLITYALWKELAWSRIAILFWWVVITTMLVVSAVQDGTPVAPELLTGAIGTAIAAWYLYARPNVRAYFRALSGEGYSE